MTMRKLFITFILMLTAFSASAGPTFKIVAISEMMEAVSGTNTINRATVWLDTTIACESLTVDYLRVNLGSVTTDESQSQSFANYTMLINAAETSKTVEINSTWTGFLFKDPNTNKCVLDLTVDNQNNPNVLKFHF